MIPKTSLSTVFIACVGATLVAAAADDIAMPTRPFPPTVARAPRIRRTRWRRFARPFAWACTRSSSTSALCNMQRRGDDVPRYAAETIARGDAFIQILRRQGIAWPQEIRRLKEAGVRINYCCTNNPDETCPHCSTPGSIFPWSTT